MHWTGGLKCWSSLSVITCCAKLGSQFILTTVIFIYYELHTTVHTITFCCMRKWKQCAKSRNTILWKWISTKWIHNLTHIYSGITSFLQNRRKLHVFCFEFFFLEEAYCMHTDHSRWFTYTDLIILMFPCFFNWLRV